MKKPTILYVCSAGHSGSTLLDLLLGGHPDILSLGEIVHLPKNIALNTLCTCGAPVRECELWSDVINQMGHMNSRDYIQNPYQLNLGYIKSVTVRDKSHQNRAYDLKWKILSGLFLSNYLFSIKVIPPFIYKELTNSAKTSMDMYEVIGKITNSTILVDSSKSYMRGLSLYEQQPDRVRVLLLTRDARGVQYSNIKRGRSGSEALMSWKKHYSRTSNTLLKTVGIDNWMHVKYEDLAVDPAHILKKICDFSSIDFSDDMLDISKKRRHLTNGNDMRFIQANEIKVDESWRTGLKPEDLHDYQSIAESLNKSFGYQ